MTQVKTEYAICKDGYKFVGFPNNYEEYPIVTQQNFVQHFTNETIARMYLQQNKDLLEKEFEVIPLTVKYEW